MDVLVHAEFGTFDKLRSECSRLHDCPFDLAAASFDPGAGIWRGVFVRPVDDPARFVKQRIFLLLTRHYFPLLETVVTLRGVEDVLVQDRAGIGTYTFNNVQRIPSGCRFVFNEDLEIDVTFQDQPRGEFRDERELSDRRGYVTSLGFVDFGIRLEAA